MKLYLDDMRPGPAGDPVTEDSMHNTHEDWKEWVIVRGVHNAKRLLELGLVTDMSLDHDLGEQETGYDLCKWMAETDNWPSGHIWVHSANPVGARNMAEFIKRYCPTMQVETSDDD